jgi:hypothetical protein
MNYISGYHSSVFVRFLHSLFIQMPAQVWFRVLSLAIPSSAQFVNHTNVSDSVLMDAWKAAQTNLATNPFPTSGQGTAGNHPPDPRALTVQPSNVAVVPVPDTPISDLIKVDPAWKADKDPSGTILIDFAAGFMEYTTVHAVTMPWTRPRVYAAASEVPKVLSYEFENIILAKLGYNVEGR